MSSGYLKVYGRKCMPWYQRSPFHHPKPYWQVENDVAGYGESRWGGWGCPWCRRSKRSIWFPWGISGKDAASIFDVRALYPILALKTGWTRKD